MPGYKKPCKYCNELVESDGGVCPYCGKIDPADEFRCPKCRHPVKKEYKACPGCGFELKVVCPLCGKEGFFCDYCVHCGKRLTVRCANKKCGFEQPPLGDKCIKCGKNIKGENI